jgi:carbon dioxide concentrating mechanism protein CcmL
LARVKGTVVSTRKDPELRGHKLLVVRAVDFEGNYIDGEDVVALDFVDAGIGDVILMAQEGDAAQQILGHQRAPVHSIIIAVVDQFSVKDDRVTI